MQNAKCKIQKCKLQTPSCSETPGACRRVSHPLCSK
jgi:hypothetical protein